MPFYAHRCTECGAGMEFTLRIADRDKMVGTVCPECQSGVLRREVEMPGFTDSYSLGRIKAPREFRDMLSKMKRDNPGSTIKER